jgi:hypothetical protein
LAGQIAAVSKAINISFFRLPLPSELEAQRASHRIETKTDISEKLLISCSEDENSIGQ